MKTFKLLLNSNGMALTQVIVASTVILGISAYVISSQMNLEKTHKTVLQKVQENVLRREMTETLTMPEVCFQTFSQNGDLSQEMNLNSIRGADGSAIYQVENEYYGKKLTKLTLKNYVPSSSEKLHHLELEISMSKVFDSRSAFSSKDAQINFRIPIFLVSTPDNKIKICGSNGNASMDVMYRNACESLGGMYDSESGSCKNLHGAQGSVLNFVKNNLCSETGGGCQHPYALQQCNGVDVRGANWNNWALKGFNQDSTISCACIPQACPDPANFCAGVDLGTNHCERVCPVGTKTTGSCFPTTPTTPTTPTPPVTPPVSSCSTWSAWSPDPALTCNGMNVEQSRTCDTGVTEVQNILGTKVDPACCSSWTAWSVVDTSKTCSSSTLTQTRSCNDGVTTATDTRDIPGTKSDSSCCSSWSAWGPLESLTCDTENVDQTRSCIDGVNTGSESKTVKGTKDCSVACLPSGAVSNTAFEQALLNANNVCSCEFEVRGRGLDKRRGNDKCCSKSESATLTGSMPIGGWTGQDYDDPRPACRHIQDKGPGIGQGQCEVLDWGYQYEYEFKCD